MVAQRGGEILAKAPAVGRAIMINDAHLIVAEAVEPIFLEEELGIVDEEIAHFGLAEVEHQPTGMAFVGKIEGVAITTRGRLPVEEEEALVAEIAARVVVHHIQEHREAIHVAEVDQRLALIHLAAQVLDIVSWQTFGIEQRVHMRRVRREIRVLHGKIHFRGEIIGPIVAEAELGLKLLDRHELNRGNAESGEVRNLARHIEKGAPVPRQVRREEGADMELINHEVMKRRRDVAGLVPREIGLPNDAVAGKRRLQLAGVGIALRALAAVPHNVEQVAIPVAHPWDETPPMAVVVAIEQAGVIARTVVKVADDMHRTGMGRPDTKGGATRKEVRTHRGARLDVIKGGRHRQCPV